MVSSLVKAAGIGAAASLLGGGASAALSAKEAKRNRDFQERMSNTAYSRAATDLENAGLNRILALGSPATTPGGAMGQVPDFGSPMSAGAQAGMQAITGGQNMAYQQAGIQKMLAETSLIGTKELQELEKTEVWQAIAPIIAQAGKDFSALINMIKSPDFSGFTNHLFMEVQKAGAETRATLNQALDEMYQEYQNSELYYWLNDKSPIRIEK